MNNQIIVVEGKNDQQKINQAFPNITVLTTNGSAINNEFLLKLKALSNNNEIILLLDPDYPGNKIRQTINIFLPTVTNAYIKKEDCLNNEGKVGIEYASIEAIKKVLSNIRYKKDNSDITLQFLVDLGYLGMPNSKTKRNNLLNKLNLGKANGKTFIKLLKAYGITKKEVLSYET